MNDNTKMGIAGGVVAICAIPELLAFVVAVAGGTAFMALCVAGVVILAPKEETSPEYQIGPRGGRYTYEKSYDGGEYKRYR